MFWQTEDGAIEKLLRAHRPESVACGGFDPDLAAAYAERLLNPSEQSRYETHLSECAACRKTAVAMMRAIEADRPREVKRIEKTIWDALKGLAVALTTPRAAIAATAVVVLAASFAFIVLRQPQTDSRMANTSQPAQKAADQSAIPSASVAPTSEPSANAQSGRSLIAQARREDKEDKAEADKAAEEKSEAAGAPSAPSEQPAKSGEEIAAAKTDEPRKAETEKSEPAAPPATEEKPLEKIEGGRRVPDDDRSARSRVSTLRPGVVDGEAREGGKEKKVIRPDDAVARGEASSSGGTAGRIAAPAGSASLRDSKDEAKRAKGTPEIRVGGKKFYFLNNTWTDRDYNPEKEMAVVPVIRGSEQYRELIAKYAGLKIYFESERFAEERAIIVYKNTVYKLSPPEK
jgi:hypothetical protein